MGNWGDLWDICREECRHCIECWNLVFYHSFGMSILLNSITLSTHLPSADQSFHFYSNTVVRKVSYLWGVIVFDEPVHSKLMTFVSILSMMLGLSGMSYASSKSIDLEANFHYIELTEDNESHPKSHHVDESDNTEEHEEAIPLQKNGAIGKRNVPPKESLDYEMDANMYRTTDESFDYTNKAEKDEINTIELFGNIVSRRTAGIIGAVCNGIFSGTSFVPMQYLR